MGYTYSMENQLKQMTLTQEQFSQSEILQRKIEQKLDDLSFLNAMVFDYWLDAICDENEEIIPAKCTEEVLNEIEEDVAYL